MAGTVYSGTYTSVINLYNPATQRPVTVTGKIDNAGGPGILGNPAFAWIVNNQGTVESTSTTSGFGIQLLNGGTVNNAVGASVAAYSQAILIEFAAGTVTNLGQIDGTGANGIGVNFFNAGGQITNGSARDTTASISGGGNGITVSGGAGSVINFGTIESSAHSAINMHPGGEVVNGSSTSTAALIANTGGANGVYINYGAGTVTNFATIKGGSSGVFLGAGGRVVNGRSGAGAGLIAGGTGSGVSISGATGGLVNFGTVENAGSLANVALNGGGAVTNGAVGATGAVITGTGTGIYINNAPGTVTNFGKVLSTSASAGTAVVLEDRGNVVNFGTIENTDPADAGVYIRGGGSIVNGRTGSSIGSISGAGSGVSVRGGPGTVTNSGSIKSATSNAVYLNSGSVTNQAGGVIAGATNGIYNRHAAIAVTNSGLIETTGTGGAVYLKGGGTVTNKAGGTIAGGGAGISLGQHGGTVTNSGVIKGTIGFYGGIHHTDHNTLINFGTVASTAGPTGVAVEMGSSVGVNKLLVVEKGAVFTGLVEGGGRGEVEFAAPGAAAMGANISGFETVALANGGADTLTLTNANLTGVSSDRITVLGGNNGNAIDASAVTNGKVTIVGGAGKDVLTGTAEGNAIFVFSTKTLSAADKITGANFNNDLEMTTPGTVAAGGVSAVQIYRLADGGANTLTLTDANFTGLLASRIEVYGGNDGNKIGGAALGAGRNLTVYGGGGVDTLSGGAGNDVFVLTAATLTGSAVDGGGGNNELEMTTAGILPVAAVTGIETYVLADGGANALSLTGANFAGVGGHVITVSDGNSGNTVSGSTLPAADRLVLYAGTGADALTGGAGGDVFFAGGNTAMTGKAGANRFTFSAPGSNTITDFGASSANQMEFVSGSGFSLPGATPTPKPLGALFTTGAFTTLTQRFSYTGGKLFYSAGGSAGTEHLVATLSGSPVLNPAQLLFAS